MQPQANPLPPAAELWDRYEFNPLTGELFSRRQRWRSRSIGKPNTMGYVMTTVTYNGDKFGASVHRLVWKWVTGEDPAHTIDHINQRKGDNRFWNLRDATWSEQMRNRPLKINPRNADGTFTTRALSSSCP